MQIDNSTFRKIKDLYGYAIAQEHIGRRTLMDEFDISRSEAEEALEAIRSPSGDGSDVVLVDRITDVMFDAESGEYEFAGEDPFGEPMSFFLPETTVKQMKRDYCMKGYTQKETALKAGVQKATFVQIRKAMEWKHASIPATEEELRGRSAEEVAQDLAMEQKKAEAKKELERSEKRELRRDARKWRKFHEVIGGKLKKLVDQSYVPPETEKLHAPSDSRETAVAVVPTFDVHFGKQGLMGPDGSYYDKETAQKRLMRITEDLVDDLTRYNIEKIILAFGSDFFHVDTDKGTTTQGTPQDLDGLPQDIFVDGCDLMERHIETLRRVAPIEGIVIPGNHDRVLSVALMKYFEALYRYAEDISINGDTIERQYLKYGQTLMGFDHGDGIRDNDILSLVMSEARELVSQTEETIFFTGHLHHEISKDLNGAMAYQLGSISGDDRWHTRNAHVGARKQMSSFIIRKQRGMHARLNYPVVI
jgi:hypothetical protein